MDITEQLVELNNIYKDKLLKAEQETKKAYAELQEVETMYKGCKEMAQVHPPKSKFMGALENAVKESSRTMLIKELFDIIKRHREMYYTDQRTQDPIVHNMFMGFDIVVDKYRDSI